MWQAVREGFKVARTQALVRVGRGVKGGRLLAVLATTSTLPVISAVYIGCRQRRKMTGLRPDVCCRPPVVVYVAARGIPIPTLYC